jgi:hypothetical protein
MGRAAGSISSVAAFAHIAGNPAREIKKLSI